MTAKRGKTAKTAKAKTPAKKAAAKMPASVSLALAAKRAKARRAKAKKVAAARKVAELTAESTLAFTPVPVEVVADQDPSKAPGKQHLHPPMSLHGVKHSVEYIAKARRPFNRRVNMGR